MQNNFENTTKKKPKSNQSIIMTQIVIVKEKIT